MIKNVNQVVKFPVSTIITSPLSEEIRGLLPRAIKGDEDANAEIALKIDPRAQKEMAFYGCSNLTDTIDIKMTLGGLLFDVYVHANQEPASPMAKHIWRKRIQELADTFDKDEFVVPDYAKGCLQRVLLSDDEWKKVSFNVSFPVVEEGKEVLRFFSLNHSGAQFFKQVSLAAAEALYEDGLL